MEYKKASAKIKKLGKNNSEKKINTFFLDLKLDFVDCNAKIRKEQKKEIGEIDGIFCYKDLFLFLLEVDESSKVDTKKQDAFFSKWSDKKNQEEIIKKYKLPSNLEIIKIFIGYNESKIQRQNKVSIAHQLRDKTNIILYKEDIEYFLQYFRVIRSWVRNDLFSFIGLKKKKLSESTDALRLIVGGRRAYLCVLSAYKLLDSCYVSRRLDGGSRGYQRIIKPNRINQISKGIKTAKILAFPNAIILNTDRKLEEMYTQEVGLCKINFPLDFCSNKVIDGQHRLLGFSRVSESIQKDHILAAVIFENLDRETEVKTFIDINNTQKKINPNLLLVLKSDFSWEVGTKFYDEARIVNLIIELNNKNSLLRNKVFLGYNEPQSSKITLTTLVGAIKKNNLVGGKIHLLENEENKIIPYDELNKIFNAIKKEFRNYANITRKGFFVSNKGIRIIFRLVQFFIRNKNKGKIQTKLSYNDFFEGINSLITKDYIVNLEKFYGEGGALKACDKIIKDLKKKYPSRYKKFIKNLKRI